MSTDFIDGISSSPYTLSYLDSMTDVNYLEKQIAALKIGLERVQSDTAIDEKSKAEQIASYQMRIQNLQAQVNTAGLDGYLNTEKIPDIANRQGNALSPDIIDFWSMSDGDLKNYLRKMQDLIGIIPGTADNNTSVSDYFTDDKLNGIRNTLTNILNDMREFGYKILPPQFADNMSNEELKSILTLIKDSGRNIPGIGELGSIDIKSLSDTQLNDIRAEFSDMQQHFHERLRDQIYIMNNQS